MMACEGPPRVAEDAARTAARAHLRALRRLGFAYAAVVFALLSCGRDVTGPGGAPRVVSGLSFVGQFPGTLANVSEGAGSVVPFDRVRVFFLRANGTVAVDRLIPFPAGADSVAVDLSVTLSPGATSSGERFDLFLRYLNPSGDTVFSGGPVDVVAAPRGSGEPPPPPAAVPLAYTGPGANAVGIRVTPETLSVVSGDPITLSAQALDAQGAVIAATPIVFSSLDSTRATVSATGAGITRPSRGVARIRAELVTEAAADTAFVLIAPRPASVALVSGGGQAAPVSAPLADSVRVQLLATDGLGIAGVPLTVAVTSGGGNVSQASVVTDINGDAAFAWTLGTLVGAQGVTVSAAGAANLVVTATAGSAPVVATQLAITQQPAPAQLIGVTTVPALVVQARDASGVPVPSFTDSVTIALGTNPGSATLAGTLRVAAVAGVATFSAWNVSSGGDGYTVVASAPGLSSATSTAFNVRASGPALLSVVTGDAQTGFTGQALSGPITVRVTDAVAAPLADVAVTFAVVSGGGSLTGATVTTNASGNATLGSWILGATPGANTITATVAGLAPLTLTATAVLPPPRIELAVFGSNVVGVNRAGTLNVRLLQPAPVGGLTVSVVSASPAVLTIATPGTVSFTAGQTLRTIEMSGLTLGNATLIATAAGYDPDTLIVPVSLNLISVPGTLNVPLAQTRSLPVQLSSAAPAGGVAVAISSNNPAVARPTTDSVFFAAGQQLVNATIEGVTLGAATITATNPNYALDRSTVSVTAELNIVAASVSLNGGFGNPITVRLESGGTPVAAPAGGVPITLTSLDATCATVAPTSVIPAGNVSVNLQVTYGGSAALPCNTRLRVEGPAGFAVDSVTASVAAQPTFSRAASSLGSGLQRSIGAALTASNHPGVTVRVTSLDSSRVFVSPSAAVAGTGSFETTLLPGATSVPLIVSSIAGRIVDTVSVRLEAPGFITHTFSVYVWQPVAQISGLATTKTLLAADDPVYASIGTPSSPAGTAIFLSDAARVGGGPLRVTFVSDNPAAGRLVNSAGFEIDSLDVFIAEGAISSPTTVASGGLAFRPIGVGTAPVRASIATFKPITPVNVTVSQPTIALTTDFLGSGLQRSRSVSTPGSIAPPGGTAITLRTSEPGVVLLAPDATTVGGDSVVVTIPAGSTSAAFTVQALDGITADTVTITATSPGFATAIAEQRVWAAVYAINGVAASGTPLSIDDAFFVSVGSPSSPTGTGIAFSDARRFGAPPLVAHVRTLTPSVALLAQTAGTGDSLTVQIVAGANNSPTTVAAGGIAVRYVAAGSTSIQATIPGAGFRALSAATQTVTVNSTALSLTSDYVGAGMMRARSVSLSAPAPAGGVPVVIRADRPGVVLFSPNATTAGADSVFLTIAQGASSANFQVHGVDGVVADTVLITASSPGFASGSAEQRVWEAIVNIGGLPATLNTLSPDDAFTVSVATPTAPGGATVLVASVRRFGAPPLVATIVSNTSTVGQLITSARTGDTVTVEIPAGQSVSPATVVAGGAAFQVLTTGTTVVSATIPQFRSASAALGQTVTIAAPALTLAAMPSIGAGLQVSTSGSLSASQHGGVNVVVKSSNPSLVRVAPSALVAATDSIIIALANGASSFTYVVAAEDSTTGQASITASAGGFTDAVSTATVVLPMIQLGSVLTTQAAFAVDDAFIVQVGVPAANGSSLTATQARRAGAAPLVATLSTSNPSVAALATSTLLDDTLTVTIAPGSATSPTSVAAGGAAVRALAPGSTTIRVTHPYIASTTTSSQATVTVTVPTVALGTPANVGAGLQVAASGSLSTGQHGGVSVVVRSSNPAVLRVARLVTDVATDSIIIPLANGVTSIAYFVAGVEGASGAVTINAYALNYTATQTTGTVVTPRLDVSGLVVSRAAGGADDPFTVRVGIPNAGNTALASLQNVRAGSSGLSVTLTSSSPAVGLFVSTPLTAGSVTVNIAAGTSATASTVATFGVAFRYLTAGTTTVTPAAAAGVVAVSGTAGSPVVTVTP